MVSGSWLRAIFFNALYVTCISQNKNRGFTIDNPVTESVIFLLCWAQLVNRSTNGYGSNKKTFYRDNPIIAFVFFGLAMAMIEFAMLNIAPPASEYKLDLLTLCKCGSHLHVRRSIDT
jgi:hypothetical protein